MIWGETENCPDCRWEPITPEIVGALGGERYNTRRENFGAATGGVFSFFFFPFSFFSGPESRWCAEAGAWHRASFSTEMLDSSLFYLAANLTGIKKDSRCLSEPWLPSASSSRLQKPPAWCLSRCFDISTFWSILKCLQCVLITSAGLLLVYRVVSLLSTSPFSSLHSRTLLFTLSFPPSFLPPFPLSTKLSPSPIPPLPLTPSPVA